MESLGKIIRGGWKVSVGSTDPPCLQMVSFPLYIWINGEKMNVFVAVAFKSFEQVLHKSDFCVQHKGYYAPYLEVVDGEYWFRVVRPSYEPCMLGFWNFIYGFLMEK